MNTFPLAYRIYCQLIRINLVWLNIYRRYRREKQKKRNNGHPRAKKKWKVSSRESDKGKFQFKCDQKEKIIINIHKKRHSFHVICDKVDSSFDAGKKALKFTFDDKSEKRSKAFYVTSHDQSPENVMKTFCLRSRA